MLIKWITCKVTENQKQSFSHAQAKWRSVEDIKGFLGQVGGWNQHRPLEACILTVWESREHYQSFMEKDHDPIFHQTGQSQTYEAISVQLFSKLTDSDDRQLLDGLESAQVLRVVCGSENNVLAKAGAEPGGIVGQSLKDSQQYIAATLWNNDQLSPTGDAQAYTVTLEQTWRVVKKGDHK
ncbi:YdbC family protein [Brevibacillus sp. MS2.2]|uniref:YdbC family protein n=1 Tax=Brevibacillus sp. MS2.2 TaxID=2738981 RepID=UPI00156AFD33|nr:YdbC family protein [Brevibacillus sp. MS2.2]NRR21421.1 YdbC family protein [Brevibacillus sp. MS2.2]